MKRNIVHDFRFITSPLRSFPDFIIPGESKCGTTSLYRYITQHPDVVPADVKEPNNFIEYGGSPLFCRMHYPLKAVYAWRRLKGRDCSTGEASAEYFSRHQVPEVIAGLLPQVRLVVLLRNPITRAYSDHQMFRKAGREDREFREAVTQSLAWIEQEGSGPLLDALDGVAHHPLRYVMRGIYVRPLRRWLDVFPRARVMVIKSETLFQDPSAVLQRVFGFLGRAPYEVTDLSVRKKGGYEMPIPEETVSALTNFYEPYNRQLYQLVGEDFDWQREAEELLQANEGTVPSPT